MPLYQYSFPSIASWVPNKTGDLSTAGTTASTVIFRKNHIYVANVGDSTGIMGVRNPRYGEPGEPPIIPKLLTKDHKPEDPEEQENIRRLGMILQTLLCVYIVNVNIIFYCVIIEKW